MIFVWRSFYGMRIGGNESPDLRIKEMGTDREGVSAR